MKLIRLPLRFPQTIILSTLVTGASLLTVVALLTATADASDAQKPYAVQCEQNTEACKVDKKTYIGWRVYHSNCYVCHAQDAVGSTFAPSLVDKIKEISHERFLKSVADGFTGQTGVMPGWKDNPNVNRRFEELYAYLKARSDGALPPGRPERIGE